MYAGGKLLLKRD